MHIQEVKVGSADVNCDVQLANNRDLACAEHGVITADQVRTLNVAAIVDPCRMHLVVPGRIAEQLGLPIQGEAKVNTADRTDVRTMVDQLSVDVCGRRGTYRAIVEPDCDRVVIGAIVLHDLDLVIDPIDGRVACRDPHRITAIIE